MTISMHEHVHERNKKRKNTQNRKKQKNNLERNPHQQNKKLLWELNPTWDE